VREPLLHLWRFRPRIYGGYQAYCHCSSVTEGSSIFLFSHFDSFIGNDPFLLTLLDLNPLIFLQMYM
jgi:hypothetical protein